MGDAGLTGNTKVTRDDWIAAALATLIHDGIDQVKVQKLAESMQVSRSSFYWYFKDRDDLLQVLLDHWLATNTREIVAAARAPAQTVTQAVCNVFAGFIDPERFDTKLDFAIRDWARRDPAVRAVLDQSDAQRIGALRDMFARFDYPAPEALARARIAYYMQIGYNDADLHEPMQDRLTLLGEYLYAYTGQRPQASEIADFRAWAARFETGDTA